MDLENFDVPVNENIQSAVVEPLIKPINRDTVHRICSGQVVLSLAIAVKELIENALDVGATIVSVCLKEYGSESIEVNDNGGGVSSENFEVLSTTILVSDCGYTTLKHYTSKIREFSDLENLGTLGFRGEALSSLCALSDLIVITKHHSAEVASKIVYDRNGGIVSQAATARETGTTVILQKLFSTLPVRRKEFMKNLKREYNRMCQLLYAYCIVSKGVKFTCTNLTSKGSKSTVVATDGKTTVRENVINVFGAKQISTLIDVELVKPDEAISSEYSIKLVEGEDLPFTFEFLISSITHGSGRSTTDRQFYFVNSRPCDPTKVSKLINEIYRQFNSGQYPFVYLNIFTKSLQVDVNVTPDKRQIYLENEKTLLATVKASLQNIFKSFPSTFLSQNLDISQMLKSTEKSERGIKRSLTDGCVKRGSILETFKKRSKTEGDSPRKILDFVKSKKSAKHSVSLNLSESDDDEKQEKKLDILVEMACNLSNEEIMDNIVDKESVENKAEIENVIICLDQPVDNKSEREAIVFDVSIDSIRSVLGNTQPSDKNKDVQVKFRSEIAPETNKSAEEELQKQISKEDFNGMEIIGQFNLGFIITKLNNDLFIVDQHATDEKYNFEQLQLTTVIDSQVLVNPKPLELTAGNESLLIENLEVFQKNGFSFRIDPEAPCTRKIALTSIPISKQYVFGKDDIDELLFMLHDSNYTMCRPSRVRSMFASRACRKSVMIGKALSKSDMKKLIIHMGEIEQPWNCPHGRPTMRHLINLDLIENT